MRDEHFDFNSNAYLEQNSNTNFGIPPASLTTLLVEPSYLHRISDAMQTDPEMAHFRNLALGSHPDFRIKYRESVPVLIRSKG